MVKVDPPRPRLKLGRATRAAGHADGQLRRGGVPASRFESHVAGDVACFCHLPSVFSPWDRGPLARMSLVVLRMTATCLHTSLAKVRGSELDKDIPVADDVVESGFVIHAKLIIEYVVKRLQSRCREIFPEHFDVEAVF